MTSKFFESKEPRFICMIPLIVLCSWFLFRSFNFSVIHDYSNSYFPAKMVVDDIGPEQIVFDIYDFNSYVWDLGYKNELIDFYLNSPFTATFYYPFALIEDANTSKLLFNTFCAISFLFALWLYFKEDDNRRIHYALFIPILFYIPIRNNVMFGQIYLLIVAFTYIGYYLYNQHKNLYSAPLLAASALLKIFPVFYLIPFAVKRDYKAILILVVTSILLMLLSLAISGYDFWYVYLTDVLPNAILNNSTTDFNPISQSMSVFLNNMLIEDVYYNPSAWYNKPHLAGIFNGVYVAIILAMSIQFSLKFKDEVLVSLSIWVIALFLIQSRTATYAQILWLIPLLVFINRPVSSMHKGLFIISLLIICNFPFTALKNLPIFFQFSRLWLSLFLAYLFYNSLNIRPDAKYILPLPIIIILFSLFNGSSKGSIPLYKSQYVIKKKNIFTVYDFFEKDNNLVCKTLGKDGNIELKTKIPLNKFDEASCEIRHGQVYYNGIQLTDNNALKKKPVAINDCEILYLTDHHGRRGAYTIKKINICSAD